MTQEIVYTSAPKGLKPGSRGFCTVVSSDGMARNLAERLEALSGYRQVFGIHDANRALNPVNWSHTTMRIGGRNWHILSRIADAGQDYSGRSNKLAHHLALDQDERPNAGPARVLDTQGVILTSWDGEPSIVPCRRLPLVAEPRTADCSAWKHWTGDPGWAGYVAEHISSQAAPASIIFPVTCQDTLQLVVEVLDLLSPAQRWNVSFSTYFTQLAPGTECRLRFVLDGTSEATALRNHPHAFVVDLCAQLPKAAGGELVDAARSGRLPAAALPVAVHGKTPDSHRPASLAANPQAVVDDVDDVEVTFASADGQTSDFGDRNRVSASLAGVDEGDDEGTYSLRSTESGNGPDQPPHRRPKSGQRAGALAKPPSRSGRKIVLIASGVIATLVLLGGVVWISFQFGRQAGSPQTGDSPPIVAQNDPPPDSAGSTLGKQEPSRPLGGAGAGSGASPKDDAGTHRGAPEKGSRESGNDSQQMADAGGQTEKSHPPTSNSGKPDGGRSDAADGQNVEKPPTTEANPKSEGRAKPGKESQPKLEETKPIKPRDAFAKLRKAGHELGEVTLPGFGESGLGPWTIHSTEPLQLTLLGGDLLAGVSRDSSGDGKSQETGFKCVKDEPGSSGGVTVWNIERQQLDNTSVATMKKLGKFTASKSTHDSASQTLKFEWHSKESTEASGQLLRWALLKLKVGNHSVVCRLGRPLQWFPLTGLVYIKDASPGSKQVRITVTPEVTHNLPPGVLSLPVSVRLRLVPRLSPLSEFPAINPGHESGKSIFELPLAGSTQREEQTQSGRRHVRLDMTPKVLDRSLQIEIAGFAILDVYASDALEANVTGISAQRELNLIDKLDPPDPKESIELDKLRTRISNAEEGKVIEQLGKLHDLLQELEKTRDGLQADAETARQNVQNTNNSTDPSKKDMAEQKLKEAASKVTQANTLIDEINVQYSAHSKGLFEKLRDQVKAVVDKVSTSELPVSLVLEIPDGERTYPVTVVEPESVAADESSAISSGAEAQPRSAGGARE